MRGVEKRKSSEEEDEEEEEEKRRQHEEGEDKKKHSSEVTARSRHVQVATSTSQRTSFDMDGCHLATADRMRPPARSCF